MPLTVSCPCSAQTHTLPSNITAPSAIVICHCLACQHRTGSAFSIGAVFVGGSPSSLDLPATSLSGQGTPALRDAIGFASRTADSGKAIERAFCKMCGATIAMWPPPPDDHQNEKAVGWLTIPAPNLRNFDWVNMMKTEKDKVRHVWTKCAVTDVPEAYLAFEEQRPRKEEQAKT